MASLAPAIAFLCLAACFQNAAASSIAIGSAAQMATVKQHAHGDRQQSGLIRRQEPDASAPAAADDATLMLRTTAAAGNTTAAATEEKKEEEKKEEEKKEEEKKEEEKEEEEKEEKKEEKKKEEKKTAPAATKDAEAEEKKEEEKKEEEKPAAAGDANATAPEEKKAEEKEEEKKHNEEKKEEAKEKEENKEVKADKPATTADANATKPYASDKEEEKDVKEEKKEEEEKLDREKKGEAEDGFDPHATINVPPAPAVPQAKMPAGEECDRGAVQGRWGGRCPLLVAADKRCADNGEGKQNSLGIVKTLSECTALALSANVTFYAWGKGDNEERCSREDTGAGVHCVGEACCQPGKFRDGQWDLFKLMPL